MRDPSANRTATKNAQKVRVWHRVTVIHAVDRRSKTPNAPRHFAPFAHRVRVLQTVIFGVTGAGRVEKAG